MKVPTGQCNIAVPSDLCTYTTCCLLQGQLNYVPSLGGNASYLSFVIILLVLQSILGVYYRTWSFSTWMVIGLLGEIVGYIGRIMLYENIFSFNAFLM